jgi:hypothetical protein
LALVGRIVDQVQVLGGPGALGLQQRAGLRPFEVGGDIAAAAGEVPSEGHPERGFLVVAPAAFAVAHIHGEAVEIGLQYVVDHPGDGVGTAIIYIANPLWISHSQAIKEACHVDPFRPLLPH